MDKKTKVTWKRVLAVCLAVTLALYSGVQLSDHVLRASEEQEPQATQTVRSNEDVDVASEGGQKTGSQEEQKTEKTEEVVLSEDAPASSEDQGAGGEGAGDQSGDTEQQVSGENAEGAQEVQPPENEEEQQAEEEEEPKEEEDKDVEPITVEYVMNTPANAVFVPDVVGLPDRTETLDKEKAQKNYEFRGLTRNLYQTQANPKEAKISYEFFGWRTENGDKVKAGDKADLIEDIAKYDKDKNKKVKLTARWGNTYGFNQDGKMRYATFSIYNIGGVPNGIDNQGGNYLKGIYGSIIYPAEATEPLMKNWRSDGPGRVIINQDTNGMGLDACDRMIRNMTSSPISTYFDSRNGNEAAGYNEYQVSVLDFPSDSEVLSVLKSKILAGDSLRVTYDGETRKITKTSDLSDFDTEHFSVKWFSVKYQNNGVHFDGIVIQKKWTGIDVPEAKDYEYDGGEKTGVAAGDGYVLEGTPKATEPGEYKVKVTLEDGYTWEDGSRGTKELVWKITDKYKITYKVSPEEGGTLSAGSEILKTKTVKSGNETVIDYESEPEGCRASEAEGYAFIGWYKGDTLVTKNAKLSKADILSDDTTKGLNRESKESFKNSCRYLDTVYTAKFAKYEELTLKAGSDKVKYDGTEHAVTEYSGLPEGEEFSQEELDKIRVSTRGTDAGEYETVFEEGAPEVITAKDGTKYNVTYESGLLTIEKRKVTLTSASKERVYDGTALKDEKIEEAGDGFADDEGADYDVKGSQLVPGSSKNSFEYTLREGTKAANYDIEKSEGTLTVTGRTSLFEIDVTANSLQKTYDGKAAKVSGFEGLEKTVNGKKYTVSGITSEAEGTDVADSLGQIPVEGTPVVTDEEGNDVTSQFDVHIIKGSLNILPRSVIMTSASGEKIYDGKALTSGGVEVTGDGFAEGEGAEYEVKGSITRVGSALNSFSYTLNEGTKAGNYSITKVPGTLVVINRDAKYEIELKANSGEETYSGKEQTVSGFEKLAFNVDGNEYTVSGLTAKGSGTNAGEYQVSISGTAVVTDADGEDVTDQFAVTAKPGTLKIAPRKLTLTSADAKKEYDGHPLTSSVVEVTSGSFAAGQGASFNVTGSQLIKGKSENKFTYELNEGTVASNYDITEKYGTLEVTNRSEKFKLAVKANSDSALYDGTEHKVSGFKQTDFIIDGADYHVSGIKSEASAVHAADSVDKIAVSGEPVVKDNDGNDVTDQFDVSVKEGSLTIEKRKITFSSADAEKEYDGVALKSDMVRTDGDGFAEGEGASFKVTGSQLVPGESANAFEWTLGEKTAEGDYDISKEEGTLKVTDRKQPFAVTMTAKSLEKKYDGKKASVGGFEEDTFTFNGQKFTVSGLEAKAEGTDVADSREIAVSGQAIVKDSEGNDVTKQFDVTTVGGRLEIQPRSVMLTSASESKTYDGKVLKNGKVEVTGDGWAEGEGADFDVTGAITRPGAAVNAFTYKLKDGAKKENYVISTDFGTLTVSNRDAKYEITVESKSDTKKYNGKEQTVTGLVTDKFTVDENEYKVTGLEAKAEGTHAGTYHTAISGEPVVRDADGEDVTSQFEIKYKQGTLKIEPRSLTIASASAEKEYDGHPLESAKAEVTEGSWVEGEGASFSFTGRQLLPGSSSNAFSYVLTEGTLEGDYKIKTEEGTLNVTDRTEPYSLTVKANSGEFLYDGSEHEVSGFETLSFTVDGAAYTVSGLESAAKGTHVSDSAEEIPVSGTAVVKDAEGNDVTSQFTVGTKSGKLIIGKRSVELESASAEKVYDGTSLVKEEVSVGGDGFAPGEGAAYTFGASQLIPGDTPNSFTYELAEGTQEGDYEITQKEGTLKITGRSALFEARIAAKSLQKTYDGKKASVSGFETLTVTANGQEYTVSGLESAAEGTDAADSRVIPVEGKAVVRDAKGNDVTDQFKVTVSEGRLDILPRSVILTSGSAEKEYDGKALKNGDVEVTGDGFVEGEGADYDVTGSITRVGSVANDFTYKLKDGTKAGNYSITQSSGTLTVKNRGAKYEIEMTAKSGEETYDGSAHKVSGFETKKFTVEDNEYTVSGLTAEGSGTDAGEYAVAVSGTPVVTDSEGNDVTEQFSVSVKPGTLKIAPRKITLRSASAEKEYDGAVLRADEVEIAEGSFAPGQGASFTVTGEQTLKGSSENTFSYVLNEGTLASNYEIKTENGTLEVKDRTEKYSITLKANSAAYKYDGEEHSVGGFEKMTFMKDGVSYTVSGIKSEASGIHVADSVSSIEPEGDAVVKDAAGNDVTDQFDVSVENGSLKIEPRKVTLTSGSAEKAFDGTAVTNSQVTVGGEGFVPGDGASYEFGASQMLIGSISNAFSYILNEGTQASDYDITTEEGTLRITLADLTGSDRFLVKAPEDVVYNGRVQEEAPVVTDSVIGRELTEGRDYTVAYTDAKDVGTVKVTITGRGNYEGAVTVTYNIKPAELVVRTESAAKQYDGKALTAEGTVTGFAFTESAPFKVTGSRTETGMSENTYEIDWNSPDATAKKGNYTVIEHIGTLSVVKNTGRVTITASDAQKVYDGKPLEAEGDVRVEGLPEGMKVKAKVTGSRTKAGVGESVVDGYTITNEKGEDVTSRFDGVELVKGQLIVSKAPLIVSTASASAIYDGKTLTNSDTDIQGLIEGESIEVKVSGKQKDVGSSSNTFTIEWTNADKDNYEVTEVPGTLTVTESDADVVLTAPSGSKVYDGKALTVKDGVTAEGLPEGFTVEATASGSITGAGSEANKVDEGYVIRDAEGNDKTGSFKNIKTVDGTLTVTPRPLTVSSASAGKYYDGEALTDETASAEGLAEGDEIEVKASGSKTDVGEAENTIEIDWKECKEGNYTVTKAPGKLTVEANIDEITITAASAEKTYDGKALTAGEAEIAGLPEGFKADVTIKGSITDAGSADNVVERYSILKGDKDVTAFFTGVKKVDGKLTVNKAPLKVTTESADKTYDGEPLTAGGSVKGLAEGEKVKLDVTGSRTKSGSETNTYELAWDDPDTTAKSGNYKVEEDLGTLTVNEYDGEITVTTEAVEAGYDGKAHGAKVKVSDLPKGYTLEEASSSASATDVTGADGSEPVKATADKLRIVNAEGEDVTDRLNITKVEGSIRIVPAVLTVTTKSAAKVYDGEPLTAEGEISGFVGGESAPLVMTGSQTKTGDSLNTYEIGWDDEKATAKAKNYRVAETVGTLHVTESADEVAVVTTGGTYTYDGKAHGASVEVTNLPKGYSVEEAASTATATDVTEEDVTATADKLVIKNKEGEDVTEKLNIKYIDGKIKITPAELRVSTPSASKEYDGEPLTAEGSITGFIGDETASLSMRGTITDVGIVQNGCEVVWDGTAKEGNYTVVKDLGSLRVVHSAKEILVTTTGGSFEYDGKEHGASVKVTGVPKGYSVKTAGSTAAARAATADPVKATADQLVIVDAEGRDVTEHLNIKYADDTIVIAPKKLKVTTDSASMVYDGSTLTAGGRVEGLVEGESVRIVTDGAQTKVGSSPNTYHLDWDSEAVAANYVVDEESIGTLTVTESADQIIITASNEAYIYDGEEHGVEVSVSQLPAGYVLEKAASTVSLKNVTGEPREAKADDVVIRNAEGEDVTEKLDIVYIDGSIEILPRTLTVRTEGATKVYDGKPLTAGGEISGFAEGEQAPFKATGSQTEVGFSQNTYAIDWNDRSATAKEDNYEVEEELGTLKIAAVPLHALRIDYVDENGKTVASTHREAVEEGAGYGPIASPEVEGYTPEYSSVEGIMPARDVNVKVVYIKNDDNGGNGGSGGSGGNGNGSGDRAGRAGSSAAPAGIIVADGGEPTIATLDDGTVPLAQTAYWALINLILAILTILIAVISLFLYFKRKDEDEEEGRRTNGRDRSGEDGSKQKKHVLMRILALIVGVIALIVFVLTEDMTLAMHMTDKWTLLMVILFALDLVLFLSAKKREKDDESEDKQAGTTTA